jgi:hypothetical protein
VKALVFIGASVAYAAFAYIAFIIFILQCGLDPGSSSACNDRLDERLPYFLAGLAVIYIVGSIWFWRRRSKDQT